jgi:hypothetical protein
VERARIQFLFGDADVDPSDAEGQSDLLDWDEENDEVGWDAGDEDEDDWLHALAGRLIVAQVAEDDPPEVWATVQRLLSGGLTRHQVFDQLRFALMGASGEAVREGGGDDSDGDDDPEGHDVAEGGGVFAPARYRELLAALPLPTATEVADAVVEVVAGFQGTSEDEVVRLAVRHLAWATGPDGGDDPARAAMAATLVEQLVDDLMDAGDFEYLPPNRLVHVERLTAGIVLTHRLTEAEAAVGVMSAGLDLAGFARREDLHLPGGADIDDFLLADGDREWQGPEGWLDAYRPGTLLTVRVAEDGTVGLAETPSEPGSDPALVARLRAVYDTEVAEPGLPVIAEALVLGLLVEDPDAFAEPRLPLATLCAAAGLEPRGGRVAHDESVWQAGYERALHWRVLDRLEGDAAEAALRILGRVGDDDPDAAALRDTLAGLAVPGVAEVVLEELIPARGVDDDADPDLIGAVRDAAAVWAERLLGTAISPAETALARWVAAVVAERRGEVLVADAHLTLATEADPSFGPALTRAAWYASDRGDAARAVRLWRRLEAPDPEDLDTVVPFTRPAGREPGRNEACWCGSGRKYKTCHLGQAQPAPLPDRVGWLCRKAVGYLKHAGPGATAAGVACALARAVDPDDPASIAEALDDPVVLDAVLTEGGWFEQFLADRGALLPDDEALLAASWTLCPRTVYEIAEVSAGVGLSVVDLRTGDRLEVRERTFSRQARPGTLVCARAVPDGETHQFIGAVFSVAPGREGDVLQLCDDADPEELCLWVRALHLPPTFVTREHEPIVACRAVLAVDNPAVAGKILGHHYEPEGDGWSEMFDLGDGERILRATLELDGDLLTVTTHSEARLDRVLSVLRAELPGATVVSDERRPLRPGEMPEAPSLLGGGEDGAGSAALDPDERASVVVQIQEQMERRWLDEPVPALGHLTPRQAAADPTRREQLIRLLASFPEPDAGSAAILLRPGRLRAALGLQGPSGRRSGFPRSWPDGT